MSATIKYVLLTVISMYGLILFLVSDTLHLLPTYVTYIAITAFLSLCALLAYLDMKINNAIGKSDITIKKKSLFNVS